MPQNDNKGAETRNQDLGSLYGRLFRGISAQTYSQIVQIIIRLAEVPLFLHFWNPELYGEWLMLSAIPAYLSMSDIGFSTTASREMTMLNSADDRDGTLRVFQSTWVLIMLLSLVVVVGTLTFIELAPIAHWLGLQYITMDDLKFVVMALVLDVLIGFQAGLLNGTFWAVRRYPIGIGLTATMQLMGFGGLATGVIIGGSPVHAALGYLLGRSLGLIVFWLMQRRVAPWIHYGFHNASYQEIHRLATPAFASLAFPLGNAFNIQGLRIILGLILGPAAVAVFVPLRTLSNLAIQPSRIINQLVQPELALAFGSQDDALFKRLVLRACQLAFWGSLAFSVILVAFGGSVLSYWTLGKISMHWPLFLFLLLGVIVNGLWYTALMVPYATNRHGRIALVYAGVYGIFAFILVYFFSKWFNLTGAGLALFIVESFMTVFVIREALRLSTLDFWSWAKIVFQPPIQILKNGITSLFLQVRTYVEMKRQ